MSNQRMLVMQVMRLTLKEAAKDELSYNDYTLYAQWVDYMSQESRVKYSFQAVLTRNEEAGLAALRWILRRSLEDRKFEPRLYTFEISVQEVDDDGLFWSPSSIIVGGKHEVVL